MTRLLALTACALLCSCATRLYSPQTGKPLATIYSNATHLAYSGGGVTLDVTGLNNSTPTNSAKRIVDSIASAGVAAFVPGSGTVPTLTRGAVVALPHVTAPKTTP